jgi:hypothetical protein
MQDRGIECNHEACVCLVPGAIDGEAYCSDHCRAMEGDETEMTACGCGHPACDEP